MKEFKSSDIKIGMIAIGAFLALSFGADKGFILFLCIFLILFSYFEVK